MVPKAWSPTQNEEKGLLFWWAQSPHSEICTEIIYEAIFDRVRTALSNMGTYIETSVWYMQRKLWYTELDSSKSWKATGK